MIKQEDLKILVIRSVSTAKFCIMSNREAIAQKAHFWFSVAVLELDR